MPALTADPTTPPQFLHAAGDHAAAAGDTSPGRWRCWRRCRSSSTTHRPRHVLGTVAGDPNIAPGIWTDAAVDGSGYREPGCGRQPKSGSSTTRPPTPTRCTSTRCVFEVVNRQDILVDEDDRQVQVDPGSTPDAARTVGDGLQGYGHRLSRPGDAVRAQFNTPGQFVWHCHIVEHEDNEMMRPYRIGPPQSGQPG